LSSVVMVVDDDREITTLLSLMLAENGYSSVTASNGRTALEYLEKCPRPSLILTDYSMPFLDGCEFVKTLSTHPRYKDIPIVIITGSLIEDSKLPDTSNFKGIIKKPFTLATILETVSFFASTEQYYPACEL